MIHKRTEYHSVA